MIIVEHPNMPGKAFATHDDWQLDDIRGLYEGCKLYSGQRTTIFTIEDDAPDIPEGFVKIGD